MDKEEFQKLVLGKLPEYDLKFSNITGQVQENKIKLEKVLEHFEVGDGVKPKHKKSLLDVAGSLKPVCPVDLDIDEARDVAQTERANEVMRKMQELAKHPDSQ